MTEEESDTEKNDEADGEDDYGFFEIHFVRGNHGETRGLRNLDDVWLHNGRLSRDYGGHRKVVRREG